MGPKPTRLEPACLSTKGLQLAVPTGVPRSLLTIKVFGFIVKPLGKIL